MPDWIAPGQKRAPAPAPAPLPGQAPNPTSGELRTAGYDAGRTLVSPSSGAGTAGAGENRPKSQLGQKVYDANATRTQNMKLDLSPEQSQDVAAFEANWQKNHARYEAVAARADMPARLIAAIHWRESSGDFSTYLHQGDPLGKPAVHEPTDIPVFTKWEDAAVHALQMKKSVKADLGMGVDTYDPAALATFAEFYNGLGYQARGLPSPYVFSGTDQYQSGKYVADGKFDPRTKDRQTGVMALMGQS